MTYLRQPCHICGLKLPVELVDQKHPLAGTRDHVIPRSKGGRTTPENIRLAHRLCNQLKSDNLMSPELSERCRSVVEPILSDLRRKHP